MAGPKNCCGVRPVILLVAKKTPMMGRVVATPSAIATIRVTHSRCKTIRRFRICHHALPRQNRKKQPKKIVAEDSIAPPTGCVLSHRAEMPITKLKHIVTRPIQRWSLGYLLRNDEMNCNGTRRTNSKLGTTCTNVIVVFAAKCSSSCANSDDPPKGVLCSAMMRRVVTAAPIAHKTRKAIHRGRLFFTQPP